MFDDLDKSHPELMKELHDLRAELAERDSSGLPGVSSDMQEADRRFKQRLTALGELSNELQRPHHG